jgi:hypothetical protein
LRGQLILLATFTSPLAIPQVMTHQWRSTLDPVVTKLHVTVMETAMTVASLTILLLILMLHKAKPTSSASVDGKVPLGQAHLLSSNISL